MSIESGSSYTSPANLPARIEDNLPMRAEDGAPVKIEDVTDENELQDTPEQAEARETLQQSPELQEAIHSEQDSDLSRVDKIMNTKDRLTRKALLFDQRDSARQWRVGRLEAKLADARARNPNSNRTRQLERKLDWNHLQIGNIRKSSGAILSRMERRGSRREELNELAVAVKELRKRLRTIAKEAQEERTRRIKVRLEAHTSKSELRRHELKAEMRSWDKNTLAKFYQERVDGALESFRRRENLGNVHSSIDELDMAVNQLKPETAGIMNSIDQLEDAVNKSRAA